ncbi:unnamed protein product [Boreogadus saida]
MTLLKTSTPTTLPSVHPTRPDSCRPSDQSLSLFTCACLCVCAVNTSKETGDARKAPRGSSALGSLGASAQEQTTETEQALNEALGFREDAEGSLGRRWGGDGRKWGMLGKDGGGGGGDGGGAGGGWEEMERLGRRWGRRSGRLGGDGEAGEGMGKEMGEAGEEMGKEMGEEMGEAGEEIGEEMGEAGEEMGEEMEEMGEEMGEVVLLHTMKAGTRALFKTVMCSPPISWTMMWTHR